MNPDKIKRAFDVIEGLSGLAKRLAEAVREEDWDRVDEILSNPLAVAAAYERAEEYAREVANRPRD